MTNSRYQMKCAKSMWKYVCFQGGETLRVVNMGLGHLNCSHHFDQIWKLNIELDW